MIIDSASKKRLAIFFFYDEDGIVDEYISYLLEDMCKNIDELFVVCNGKLSPEGRETFSKFTQQILVRKNEGFDVWAYKEAIEQIGWEHLWTFDEVIFFNFTIMGPLYPFSEMFNKMDQKDLDFWGITKYHGASFDVSDQSEDEIPQHIQSHFIAVRRNMTTSLEFMEYWASRPPIKEYDDAVNNHEAIFTKHFANAGFSWDVYVDTDALKDFSPYPLMMCATELIKNKRCPIFKRSCSYTSHYDYLATTTGQPAYDLIDYITHSTDYDENLIWDNILRSVNQADFKKAFHLNYVASCDQAKPLPAGKKIALVMHLYFMDLLEESYHYASAMSAGCDIYLTTTSAEKKEAIEAYFRKLQGHKITVIQVENRGRDVSAILIGTRDFIMDYDYVCFAHDKKVTQLIPYCKGAGFSYKCFENVLKNENFVTQVIDIFEKNPRLGMLMPPPPNHSDYYPILGREWGENFENTKQLLEKLNIKVPLNPKKEPISPLGSIFWCRPKALKPLFSYDWKYEDFPEEPLAVNGTISHAIERARGYIAQHEGYYPGWILSDQFAKIELTNLTFMLRELNLSTDNYLRSTYALTWETVRDELEQRQKAQSSEAASGKQALKNILKRRFFHSF